MQPTKTRNHNGKSLLAKCLSKYVKEKISISIIQSPKFNYSCAFHSSLFMAFVFPFRFVAAATFFPKFLKFWTLLFYFILLRSVWIHELCFILPFATVWFEVMSIAFMLFGKPLPVGKRINTGV